MEIDTHPEGLPGHGTGGRPLKLPSAINVVKLKDEFLSKKSEEAINTGPHVQQPSFKPAL